MSNPVQPSDETDPLMMMFNALSVLVREPRRRAYLLVTDPMAVKQAEEALLAGALDGSDLETQLETHAGLDQVDGVLANHTMLRFRVQFMNRDGSESVFRHVGGYEWTEHSLTVVEKNGNVIDYPRAGVQRIVADPPPRA